MAKPAVAISVKELTRIVKALLEGSDRLSSIWVRGEISNYKRHSSGHLYFTLKDDAASVRCVMFRTRAQSLKFEPENGMAVLILGSVSVYEKDGQYQLYVDEIQADGVGSLYKAFLQLKEKLEAEGLFDAGRKRTLPQFPRKVGVVTSMKGAAIRDIINIARRRWSGVSLVIADVLVQGETAPVDIIRGLDLVSRVEGVEVIIVGRGGGSIEELWAFNSELLARAIYRCPVPVVSAVGHETDFTIADFVADLRAPTPSAAAELVVPDVGQLCQRLSVQSGRITTAMRRMLSLRRYAVAALSSRPVLRRGLDIVNQRRQVVDEATRALSDAVAHVTETKAHKAMLLAGRLDALSPLKILARGYSICTLPDGSIVKDVLSVEAGGNVNVRLLRGRLQCVVREKSVDQ